jgi:Tfp pilus assembly PilM family ATPase
MAKTCGIRVGPRRFEIVVLDGTAKKHRITAFRTGEFPQGGENPMADAVQALSEAVKDLGVPSDSIGVAIDSGLAAYRTLKLPVLDESKIAEIIKFEVENQLPQWNVDDVVVDFLTLDKTESETNLLVTAVQKVQLQRELDLCAQAGVEPQEAELEATAMVNAAVAADICHVDDAQLLVHIGEASTAVVVMDGGRVRSMRAIRIGALAHDAGAADPALAPGDAGERPVVPALPPEELQRRLEQSVSRIRRELVRTVSGARTANPIAAIYVCGWELPDLVGSTITDVPVYELDVFEADSGQPAQGTAPLVVAYGVALRQLGGGPLRASLRREELRYTGTLERLEMPLAIAVLLLITWLAIVNIFEHKRLQRADGDIALWLQSTKNFLISDPKLGSAGNLSRPWPELQSYVQRASQPDGGGLEESPNERLIEIERRLKTKVAELNSKLGLSGEVTQPQSALEALTRVTCVIHDLKDRIGRISIRKVMADTQPARGGESETVMVTLDLSFFNDTSTAATLAYETLKSELETQPWVKGVRPEATKEFPADQGAGIYTEGFTVLCDMSRLQRPTEGS